MDRVLTIAILALLLPGCLNSRTRLLFDELPGAHLRVPEGPVTPAVEAVLPVVFNVHFTGQQAPLYFVLEVPPALAARFGGDGTMRFHGYLRVLNRGVGAGVTTVHFGDDLLRDLLSGLVQVLNLDVRERADSPVVATIRLSVVEE